MSEKLSKTGKEMMIAAWGAAMFAVMFTAGQLYLRETKCQWIEATGAFAGEPLYINMDRASAIVPGGTGGGKPAQALVYHSGQNVGVLETPDELVRRCNGEEVVTKHKFVPQAEKPTGHDHK